MTRVSNRTPTWAADDSTPTETSIGKELRLRWLSSSVGQMASRVCKLQARAASSLMRRIRSKSIRRNGAIPTACRCTASRLLTVRSGSTTTRRGNGSTASPTGAKTPNVLSSAHMSRAVNVAHAARIAVSAETSLLVQSSPSTCSSD